MVYLVQPNWGSHHDIGGRLSKPIKEYKAYTLSQVRKAIAHRSAESQSMNRVRKIGYDSPEYDKALDAHHKAFSAKMYDTLFGFMTDYEFRPATKKALQKALTTGLGIAPQTSDTEGWAISTRSMKEALSSAKIMYEEARDKAVAEQAAEKLKSRKQARTLWLAREKVADKPVFFAIQQDYAYRGLHDYFEGTVKLGTLYEYQVAMLEDNQKLEDEIETQLVAQFDPGDMNHFGVTFSESFRTEPKLVQKLAKTGLVEVVGDEIAVHAFSLNSLKQAKAAVKKMFKAANDLNDY